MTKQEYMDKLNAAKVSALFVDAQRLDGNQCAIPVDMKLCKS